MSDTSATLYHHGIKGQKWGVRRYQNKDGSLTPAGKKRAAKLESQYESLTGKKVTDKKADESTETKSKKTSVKDLSDKDLQDKVHRLNMESRYKELTKNDNDPNKELKDVVERTRLEKEYYENQKRISELNPKHKSLGRKVIETAIKDVIKPAAISYGKKYIDSLLNSGFDKVKNKVENATKDTVNDAKKTADKTKDKSKNSKAEYVDPDDVTVEGSSSRSKTKTSSKSKKKKDTGPIDVDYWYVDEPASNLPAVYSSSGRRYISGLLGN